MTFRDLAFVTASVLLAVVGIIASFLRSEALGMTALFLLGLLIVFLLVLQRRAQSRLQERVLYLVKAEKSRTKVEVDRNQVDTFVDANAVQSKKIIGILQAQQMSMERLRRDLRGGAN